MSYRMAINISLITLLLRFALLRTLSLCVCVCERERERETKREWEKRREKGREKEGLESDGIHLTWRCLSLAAGLCFDIYMRHEPEFACAHCTECTLYTKQEGRAPSDK